MVCFMILHYMVADETIQCVDSILSNVIGDKHILVVDNCSPNGSFEVLRKHYKDNSVVSVIQNESNNGFAKGNNFGYRYALEYIHPDYICCMNNDMTIEQKDFIEQLYLAYDRTHFYVLGPDVYSVSARIHQNPEHKILRDYNEVCRQLEYFKKRGKNTYKFYLKGFLKNIPAVNSLYYKVKDARKHENEEWKEEIIGTAIHGSCVIFSPDFIFERKYAFYPETTFYCEAQILDYECHRDHKIMVYSPRLQVNHFEDVATNAVFNKYAQKAIFVNTCMIESLTAFKKLMENDKSE